MASCTVFRVNHTGCPGACSEAVACCRYIHDSSLPTGVQVTSVRLLLNLVEVIFNRRADPQTAEAYRALLARSLDACVSRLAAVEHSLPRLLCTGTCTHALIQGMEY